MAGLAPPLAPPLWIYDAAVVLVGAALALSSATGREAVRASAQSLADGFSRLAEGIKKTFPATRPSAIQPCPLSLARAQGSGEESGKGTDEPKTTESPSEEELAGKSPEEIDHLMKERGWPSEPTRDGPGSGVRYPNPVRPGDQVRVMPGKATDPNLVKQGPYARISKSGKVSGPIPLKGNPTWK